MTEKQIIFLLITLYDKLTNLSYNKLNKFFISQAKLILKEFFKIDLNQDINSILPLIVNENQHKEKLTEILNSVYNIGYRQGSNFLIKTNNKTSLIGIDLSQAIQEYIDLNTAREVSHITDTTQKNLKKDITVGLSNGETRKQIAQRIKDTMMISSTSRALMIADTESHNCISAGSYNTALMSSLGIKKWNTMVDEKVRDSHELINNQEREINKKFSNGLMFPGDSMNGTAKDVIRCRCFLTYD